MIAPNDNEDDVEYLNYESDFDYCEYSLRRRLKRTLEEPADPRGDPDQYVMDVDGKLLKMLFDKMDQTEALLNETQTRLHANLTSTWATPARHDEGATSARWRT